MEIAWNKLWLASTIYVNTWAMSTYFYGLFSYYSTGATQHTLQYKQLLTESSLSKMHKLQCMFMAVHAPVYEPRWRKASYSDYQMTCINMQYNNRKNYYQAKNK